MRECRRGTEHRHRGNTFFRPLLPLFTVVDAGFLVWPGGTAPGLFYCPLTLAGKGAHMLQYPSDETVRMASCLGEVLRPC